MQQARKLRRDDKVAIVSLSSGMLGEEYCSHNIEIGVMRLREYGLEPVFMPNALKGVEYLKNHPEAGAAGLKLAFLDDTIAGIICALPVVYNLNFGIMPRLAVALQYGAMARVDMEKKIIIFS